MLVDLKKFDLITSPEMVRCLSIKCASENQRQAVLASGVNFIVVLGAAFGPVDPKSVKRYWWLDWIFTLLGATGVKVSRKYVGEIEPGPEEKLNSSCFTE